MYSVEQPPSTHDSGIQTEAKDESSPSASGGTTNVTATPSVQTSPNLETLDGKVDKLLSHLEAAAEAREAEKKKQVETEEALSAAWGGSPEFRRTLVSRTL